MMGQAGFSNFSPHFPKISFEHLKKKKTYSKKKKNFALNTILLPDEKSVKHDYYYYICRRFQSTVENLLLRYNSNTAFQFFFVV